MPVYAYLLPNAGCTAPQPGFDCASQTPYFCGGNNCSATIASCTGDKVPACNCTNSCVCPSAKPVACAGNSCQPSAAAACETQNRVTTSACPPTSCGACKSGFTDCSGACVTSTSSSCAAPKVYDPCTGSCTDPYVLVNPVVPQTGFFNVSGNSRVGGDLTAVGDVYLNNGRAIRLDSAGVTELHIGNWAQNDQGATIGQGANVFVWGNFNVGGPQF
ncbi:MAG: hypothetical protein AABX37_03520, partial [Nanoarchaeota archaeon]